MAAMWRGSNSIRLVSFSTGTVPPCRFCIGCRAGRSAAMVNCPKVVAAAGPPGANNAPWIAMNFALWHPTPVVNAVRGDKSHSLPDAIRTPLLRLTPLDDC